MPSLASRSALSSLSSCDMTLDAPSAVGGSDWGVDEDGRDGSDERDERVDDVRAFGERGESEFTQRRREELGWGGWLSSWRVRRPNASMPLRALCPSVFAEGGRGDVGRRIGVRAFPWPGSRAGRWDNAPYQRWEI